MATPVVTYTRGSTYIKNISDGKTCYALLGDIVVVGLAFDAIERFNLTGLDFVHLNPRDYMPAVMYWNEGQGRVINPWNGYGPTKKQNNILVHAGSKYGAKPSNFEGCIGPGSLETKGKAYELSLSPESMEVIWDNCGGTPGSKPGWNKDALQVCFRVANEFPDRKTLTKSGG